MSSLIIRQNISVPDPVSHFSSLWTQHSTNLGSSWLTDIRLVTFEQKMNMTRLHQPVLLPLCPFLAQLVKENSYSLEEVTLLLPDFSAELVHAFRSLIYEGVCPLTEVTTVQSMLNLLETVGFDKKLLSNVGPDYFEPKLVVEKVNKGEVFSNRSGEDASSSKCMSHVIPFDIQTIKASLDCPLPKCSAVVNEVAAPLIIQDTTREAKDDAAKDLESEGGMKLKRAHDDKYSCQFCDFKCRFFIQLVKHSNSRHASSVFNCDLCSYRGAKLMSLKIHKKHVHEGNSLGDFECDICGVKVLSLNKLIGHKKQNHKQKFQENKSGKDLGQNAGPSSNQHSSPKVKTEISSVKKEGRYFCPICSFRSLYKPSLLRHMKTFHKT
jgi:DNA-directed RNA polymerase subunit RPC12/RpoP